MTSRPSFFGYLVLFAALAARAYADDAAAVPECPASPAAVEQPTSNNVRLVTGSPYSALGISQTVTTLPDGRRIVRQNTIRQWRDSGAGEFVSGTREGAKARPGNRAPRHPRRKGDGGSVARGRSNSTPPSPSSTTLKSASATCCSPPTRWRSPCPSFPAA